MKRILLLSLALPCLVHAQVPSGSYLLAGACGGATNPTSLYNVNVDGSTTLVGAVTYGGNPITVNASGYTASSAYALSVPATLYTAPDLYAVSTTTGVATMVGTINPPPSPTTSFGTLGFTIPFNFIGDSDPATGRMFIGGITFKFSVFTGTITDVKFYLGTLYPDVSSTTSWTLVGLDAGSQAVFNTFAAQAQAYISAGFTGPIPSGGFQDWVFDEPSGTLKSYLGIEGKFTTISGVSSTNPLAVTTTPTTLIPGTPGANQEMGAMFKDKDNNYYAVNSADGVMYKIDASGNYLGQSWNSGRGCFRGDGVSKANAIPLPVTMVSFNAAAGNGKTVLNWVTIQEINVKDFTVERSANTNNWTSLSSVKANNGSGEQRYSYTDNNALNGLSYYRLKITDLDGTVKYSDIVSTNNAAKNVISVFPNPASQFVKADFASIMPSGSFVELVNVSGQTVYRENISLKATTIIDVARYAKGNYVLKIISGNTTHAEKLIIK